MVRAICSWSSVENCKMYPEAEGETQNNTLLTFGELVSTFAINNSKRDLNSAPRGAPRWGARRTQARAKKCVERYCELANRRTQQLYKVSTSCIDDHHFKEEETKSVGELSKVCSQIVLICSYLARIGRPDILWSVNKLARSITKWTKACDQRLSRLISYIRYTSE